MPKAVVSGSCRPAVEPRRIPIAASVGGEIPYPTVRLVTGVRMEPRDRLDRRPVIAKPTLLQGPAIENLEERHPASAPISRNCASCRSVISKIYVIN